MKIYTRTGDSGQTGLFNGTRVSKDHLRIETYGTIDELNSFLGLAIVDCPNPALRTLLQTLQHQLFDLGADLATPLDSKNAAKVRRIGLAHILFLENQIDAATDQLPPLKNFILPGGTLAAARLHIARTIARRAERLLVTLNQTDPTGEHPLIYLNRLSDLLFTLARLANHLQSTPDIDWSPT
jgi:cob(I)alamin adenosyltransferase